MIDVKSGGITMARYIKNFVLNGNLQQIQNEITAYLQNDGYKYIEYDGENVFKKGMGIFSAPTFFKFIYNGNCVRMETWMKYTIVPGVFVGELSVDGFVGAAVKGRWKTRIAYIESIFNRNGRENVQTGFVGYNSFGQESVNRGVNYNQNKHNNENDTELLISDETELLNNSRGFYMQSNSKNVNNGYCPNCGTLMSMQRNKCQNCGYIFDACVRPQQSTPSNIGCTDKNISNPMQNEANFDSVDKNISKKEFIKNYASASVKRDVKAAAVIGYVCAAVTFVFSCFFNPYGIIDALILAAVSLGMHLSYNKVFAVLLLILSLIEFAVAMIEGMTPPVWWLVAGILAVYSFRKFDKEYKTFKSQNYK